MISIKEGAFNIGKLAFHLSTAAALQSPGEVEEVASPMRIAPKMDELLDQKERELDSAQIDFTPLFQCIHIHDVLNKRVQLKLEFDESRRVFYYLSSYKQMSSLHNQFHL